MRTQTTYSYSGAIKSQPVYKENRTLEVHPIHVNTDMLRINLPQELYFRNSLRMDIGKLPRNNLSFIMLNL